MDEKSKARVAARAPRKSLISLPQQVISKALQLQLLNIAHQVRPEMVAMFAALAFGQGGGDAC